MYIHQRTVRFQDTDAAGVVYFSNGLAICHEAYEASLQAAGIDLKAFFKGVPVAVPIVHASVDFLRPISVGDRLEIHLTPHQTDSTEFEIHYQLCLEPSLDKPVIKALTRHVCIDAQARTRQELPPPLITWLNQWAPVAVVLAD
ncbi:acyl-CoA thioesterase [Phormidium sp. CLA17]|uniref:acyl-CoA thioesterase n=1 Tax=Leptolyngbya sp. Cla-17 TaxID=2803751 RepID=UPI001490B84A|nr:thioesterase family protein [Leptolyngbya sp. Cla-17]MBM0743143.1 acyl-CoA thioesterase [Leptolyngbya sp. Cla-17]